MRYSKAYILLFCLLFATFAVVFNTFPRSTFSELEKRELARFPDFTPGQLSDGSFTTAVSSWFSDTEPFRDHFMSLSMHLKDLIRLQTGDDNITFHASTDTEVIDTDVAEESDPVVTAAENDTTGTEPAVAFELEENAKIANAGIIIVGSGERVRALMAYGGSGKGCTGYAQAANKYKETFPDVNIYCMVIPTAVEYYCPEKVRRRTNSQRATIDNVIRHLSPDVKPVDIYATLGAHANEDIFLRTDHHWAPLGAFYAAEKFAEVAGVPFRDLSSYDRKVVHGYVGSMYGYSQDISIKNAPEDFVYYVPRDVTYTTTYINYTIDEDYRVIGMGRPYKSAFFFRFRDGSGGAYCTFMGGDTKITCVRTSTKNGRRLIILKDSFGNALPSNLFYSFEEIHIIDSRYFKKNMVDYVRNHQITDILFANNIFKAYSSYTYGNYLRFLQQDGSLDPLPTATPTDSLPPLSADTMTSANPRPTTDNSLPTAAPQPSTLTPQPTTTPPVPADPTDTVASHP